MSLAFKQKGFTLIEVVLACAIGAILILTVAMLIRQGGHYAERNRTRAIAIRESRECLETIQQELRRARAGDWQITYSDEHKLASELSFVTVATDQRTRIFLEGDTVKFQSGDRTPRALAHGVKLLMFTAGATNGTIIRVSYRQETSVPGASPHVISVMNRAMQLTES